MAGICLADKTTQGRSREWLDGKNGMAGQKKIQKGNPRPGVKVMIKKVLECYSQYAVL